MAWLDDGLAARRVATTNKAGQVPSNRLVVIIDFIGTGWAHLIRWILHSHRYPILTGSTVSTVWLG